MPKEDTTPMAELKNWADRVKSEVGASVAWENDWGELYKPNAPKGYEERIAQIEAELKSMPGSSSESTHRAHYRGMAPVKEIRVPTAGARSADLKTNDPDEILGSSGCAMIKM